VESLAETEQGKDAIVYGGQVAEQVEHPVLIRSDLLLELLIGELCEEFIEAADNELP